MTTTYSSEVRYHPWIGDQYKEQKIRWLILGESGYKLCSDERRETEWMILAHNGVSHGGWESMRYDVCIATETLMTGSPKINENERWQFWNSVAFYNFVCESMPDAQTRPTRSQFLESRSAFSEVIRTHKPHAVLVMGIVLWGFLPGIKDGWEEGQNDSAVQMPRPYRPRLLNVWTGYSDGQTKEDPFACFPVAHYASRRFDANKWATWMTAAQAEIERRFA
ncbi:MULTISPECIES: hypothetical protein [Burkholderia]|nr:MULTISPECIES: hypothetical protein [Burkholderia]MBU9283783.1 hypothetical protein [Burkholderia multivorans]MCZ2901379.1 hypothetical protein [Burkholderia thailandensis]MDD1482190.1 hypothetical protein [Burkholderia thailandensis]MDD1490245.1 hypothetical protein [Burkholderia thailandensis]MDD1496217.1 hypothetical protein [Burkholderia thailandensis]